MTRTYWAMVLAGALLVPAVSYGSGASTQSAAEPEVSTVGLSCPAGTTGPNHEIGDFTIMGDYLEARTSDVYTGPCFANGEVNLTGKEAVMAWRIRRGAWQGVDLSGLAVVAVVKASATLGDPFRSPYPARSVIVVDQEATSGQRESLVDFARSMGGSLLEDVVAVRATPIETDFSRPGYASVKAGDIVELKTRALNHEDHICGNESVYYPPLTEVSNAIPAYTLAHVFRGDELASTWSCPLKRSAFVAQFAR